MWCIGEFSLQAHHNDRHQPTTTSERARSRVSAGHTHQHATHSLTALNSEYEDSMPDSSLSGETTSAKQPRELVAHSRNGESESDTLFFPLLRGVLPPSATQPLGLCMVLPSMPSTPGMQPEAVRRWRREAARIRTGAGAGADSHLGSFPTRLDCAHWTGGRCPWHPRSGAAGAWQSCGTRSCRAEAAAACETETRTYCCLAHLPTTAPLISGPAECNWNSAHTGAPALGARRKGR